MTDGGSDAAVVTLTADTSAFDQALDRAAASTQQWADGVEQAVTGFADRAAAAADRWAEQSAARFDRMKAAATAAAAAVRDRFQSAAAAAGEAIGRLASAAGERLTAAVGRVAAPVGRGLAAAGRAVRGAGRVAAPLARLPGRLAAGVAGAVGRSRFGRAAAAAAGRVGRFGRAAGRRVGRAAGAVGAAGAKALSAAGQAAGAALSAGARAAGTALSAGGKAASAALSAVAKLPGAAMGLARGVAAGGLRAAGYASVVGAKFNEITRNEEGESKSSEAIGRAVGGGVGAAIGTYLMGPMGTQLGESVGKYLGEIVGNNFDLAGLAETMGGWASSAKETVTDVFKAAGDAWGFVRRDVGQLFDYVKQLWGSLVPKSDADLAEHFDEVGEYAAENWDSTLHEMEQTAARSLDRIATAVDGVWEKVREPLAFVADYVQMAGQRLGLVAEGTAKWGDSLRQAGNIGRRVAEGLAGAFGALEGVLRLVGGYFLKYVVLPIAEQLPKLFGFVQEMFAGMAQISRESLGGFMAKQFDGAAAAVGRMNDKLKAGIPDARKLADELTATKIEDRINHYANMVKGLLDAGRKQNQQIDAFGKLFDAQVGRAQGAVTNLLTTGFEVFKLLGSGDGAGGGQKAAVAALVSGTQEASNLILRNMQGGGGADNPFKAAQRQADAAERSVKIQENMVDKLESIRDRLGNAPIIETV